MVFEIDNGRRKVRKTEMNICVCDDDKNFIQLMYDLLRELVPGNHLLSFTSGFAMLDYIQREDTQIDLLFLDIEMPGLNGLETATELRISHPHMAVVIVTSYPQYAVASFDFSPIHYVLKPVNAEIVKRCLERAMQIANDDVLLIKTRKGVQFIQLHKIYALESCGLQVCIILDQQMVSVYQTLTYYEKLLFAKGFYRVHSGAIINLEYVLNVDGNVVTLTQGGIYDISRRKKKDFMSALLKWRKAYG